MSGRFWVFMQRFTQATFDWMAAIALNNSREQFLATKAQYEGSVKAPFVELLAELSKSFGGTPKVFRPNRDIRFSTDKRPYKTNISGFLEGAESAGYVELSMDGLMAATGYYQMTKDQLERFRAALTSEDSASLGAELRELMHRIGARGDGLKTVPRGIAKDHPNADLLGFTSITYAATLPPEQVVEADVRAFVEQAWTRARPLNQWLDERVGQA
jgi:uncharacterized protein (TIGR02453 family)